ncbi:hypothetical protein [Mucilaginibacter celer]|uniref:O-antigen ligase domain-containing protein n=1 Tax=Mucilaginibacter celer TaxID=2305508 RepID=A0A494VQ19_9SPHI|nr:hypothetical protein [Mucilaginibacter celer]AYL96001.1 hypothetical protein HYN43_012200 [Mucilaginibacter celer]
MTAGLPGFDIKKWKSYADWRLLIFLLLFINVKIPVKAVAILFVYLSQPDFKFGFRLKNSRLPLFYLLVFPIAAIAFITDKSLFMLNYLVVFGWGMACWLLALLAIHQLKLMVDKLSTETIYHTLIVFFIINALFSAGNLAYIMWVTKTINPYTFRGMNQQYFINTGDNIAGISFDISSTNAIICAFGVLYFVFKRNLPMVIVCMSTLALTYSNLVSMLFSLVLAFTFIFKSTRDQKSLIVVAILLYVVSLVKISPQNEGYIDEMMKQTLSKASAAHPNVNPSNQTGGTLSRDEQRRKFAQQYLDSLSNAEAKKEKTTTLDKTLKKLPQTGDGRVYIPPPDTFKPEYFISHDTTPDRKQLLDFINQHYAQLPLCQIKDYIPHQQGKITGMIQTINYLKTHPQKSIVGLGIGNFSSKIAFRATGAGIRGQYSPKRVYIHPAFMANHLDLYLCFFSKNISFRSVRNSPSSTYDQLLSEYGILGLVGFMVYYLGYFARYYKKLSYGIPILMLAAGVLFIDYWFEQLSVMVVFELLLLLNIKETTPTSTLKTETKVAEGLVYA